MIKTFLQVIIFFLVATPSALALTTQALEEKLQSQWEQYGAARQRLLEMVKRVDLPPEQRMISREEWEALISLDGEATWTEADLLVLKENQRQRIEAARQRALKESKFNLDKLRHWPGEANGLNAELFCSTLPKGGMLHVHPSGTLDLLTVHSILTTKNPTLSFKTLAANVEGSDGKAILYPDELHWLKSRGEDRLFKELSLAQRLEFERYFFLPMGKHSFPRFNAVFEFIATAIPDWESYETALLAFAKRATRSRLSYVEFTSTYSPELAPVLDRIEKETGLMIRVNQSFNRTKPVTELEEGLRALLDFPRDKWLVGIDLLDDETQNSALDKAQLLYGGLLDAVQSGRSQLHRTMHAGEMGDVRNSRDAMILGAERLGHGVRLHEDPIALEYAARHRIPVEINLSSNLRLTDITSLRRHPFLDYLRLGIPVSLSTDDEGIFETDINRECVEAISETDVTYEEMKQMAFNAIETSFAHDADKAALQERLKADFVEFERTRLGILP